MPSTTSLAAVLLFAAAAVTVTTASIAWPSCEARPSRPGPRRRRSTSESGRRTWQWLRTSAGAGAPGRWSKELMDDPLDHRIVRALAVFEPPVLEDCQRKHREQIDIAGRRKFSPLDGALDDHPGRR